MTCFYSDTGTRTGTLSSTFLGFGTSGLLHTDLSERIIFGAFKLMRGLFFNEASVFETHNQLELLSFHTCDFTLIELLLIGFLRQFAFNLRASAILPFNKVHVALHLGFVILLLDLHLNLLCLLLLDALIVLPFLSVSLLFGLGFIRLKLSLGLTELLVLSN
jgi:hypothetical protein